MGTFALSVHMCPSHLTMRLKLQEVKWLAYYHTFPKVVLSSKPRSPGLRTCYSFRNFHGIGQHLKTILCWFPEGGGEQLVEHIEFLWGYIGSNLTANGPWKSSGNDSLAIPGHDMAPGSCLKPSTDLFLTLGILVFRWLQNTYMQHRVDCLLKWKVEKKIGKKVHACQSSAVERLFPRYSSQYV